MGRNFSVNSYEVEKKCQTRNMFVALITFAE
jgi:hypothetical protein